MATVKAVNRTILDATGIAHTLKPGKAGGHVSVMVDTYEASALPSGDIIEVGGDLPIGAQVLEVIVYYDALGAGVTLKVGDAEDDDRYLEAFAASTAGSTRGNLANGAEYEVDNTTTTTPDTQVLITVGGASATGTIKAVVLYTNE